MFEMAKYALNCATTTHMFDRVVNHCVYKSPGPSRFGFLLSSKVWGGGSDLVYMYCRFIGLNSTLTHVK